ncbi:MAG TPA: ornithine cyclodeaminase family protein [Blastocatellia bacterium]|jgi:alanine dehydrogenase|nr:ornithine cyclodeaminase family protein [Blastocatellia bacterium]
MKPDGTLLLKRHEIAALLNIEECMQAVEQAFKLYAEGKTTAPGVLGIPARDGGFHIKAGVLELGRTYFAAKTNANFPQNMRRFGLPLIQGIIVLCDGENGYPLALMDSMEITIIRTGAATGVAAKYLARTDAHVATICGCGNQGRISLRAIAKVRDLSRAYAWDIDQSQARRFADELSRELNIEVGPVDDLAAAVGESDICVTCTPSKEYFLKREYVSRGTFIAAVGADSEDKQELDPALIGSNKVVVDLLEQCASIGELHHALNHGLLTKQEVHAELGEVITGKKAGRTSEEEIITFDSTGTALQDVAAAAIVYERAVSTNMGRMTCLS